MKQFFLLVAATFLFLTGSTSLSFAFDRFPECTSGRVLGKIEHRFNQTEKIYWRERGLRLLQVDNPHTHQDYGFPDSSILRRYCHGTAHFTDGKQRKIHYLIEADAGFAGFTWNVEYCVHGLDPWKYHDGRCRVLSR